MNLWGRAAGILFLAFLVFVGCQEDEASLVGFRKPDTKFKVSYIEVDVPTSVMLIDSVRTFNDPTNSSAEKRLLVGRYTDPDLGIVTAKAYTQFRPLNTGVEISTSAQLVSAYLNLTYDYYYYGGSGITQNTITVHALTDSIRTQTPYFSDSEISYDPSPIGNATFNVDPLDFDKNFIDNQNADTSLHHFDTLSIKLDPNYSLALFNLAKSQSFDYVNFSRFKRVFKGFALIPGADSRVVGFDPENTLADPSNTVTGPKSQSRVIINYDEPDPDTGALVRKQIEFYLFVRTSTKPQIGFTQFTADRSGTAISSISQPFTPMVLSGDKRYLQSGSPVMPVVDFSSFLSFTDTIPNVVLNSVEFSLEPDDPQTYAPPHTLRLRVLKDNNEFKLPIINPLTPLDTAVFTKYGKSITQDEEGYYIIGVALNQDKVAGDYDINFDSDKQSYSGDLTQFFQTLSQVRDDQVFKRFGMLALEPYYSRSVNRLVFNKDKIKLKIFYTVPLVDFK